MALRLHFVMETRCIMNNRISLGSLTIGAVLLAGLLGLLTAVHKRLHEPAETEFDEINDSPIGI